MITFQALSFTGESCHNDNNPVKTLDNMTKDFLVKLNGEGRFDNAILIMMSDHGARFANRSIKQQERKKSLLLSHSNF